MCKKKTTKQFIEESKKVHGDRYDYSLVDYKNIHTKIDIICPIHGIFEQRIDTHLEGHGCRKCYNDSKIDDNYLKEVNKLYNEFYTYPDGYKNTRTKIKIICPIHGVFYKYPHHHKNGDGCNKCKLENNNNEKLKKFIIKSNIIHKNKFNYDNSIYIGYKSNITIMCPIHGNFTTKPILHLNGHDCKKCSIDKSKKDTFLFINQGNYIHNNKYEYPDNYIDSNTKIKIICPIHGEFYQLPKNHISNKQGCPKCSRSKGELEIERILINRNVEFTIEKKFKDCIYKSQLPFDFFLPKHNIIIEFDGEQHFRENIIWGGGSALKLQQIRDNIKTEYCLNNNIQLIRIKYDDNIEEKLKILFNE